MNSISISGRLVADPVRRGSGEKDVVAIRIANDAGYGKWKKTTFINVTVFGKQATWLVDNLTKGAKVGVEGRIEQNDWETKDGQKRSEIRIVANNIESLEPYGDDDRGPRASGGGEARGKWSAYAKEPIEDDVPF